MSINQPPRGKSVIPITQELIQRIAAYITQSGGQSLGLTPFQNELLLYQDNCDATHPLNIDFVIPANFQRMLSMRLSFKIRPFRTYNTITGTNTGIESANHSHNHNHGSHGHTLFFTGAQSGGNTIAILFNGAQLNASSGAAWNDNGGTVGGTTPNTDGTGQSNDHTHPLNLSQVLGITEASAPVNPGITVSYDGTPITAQIMPAGPYNGDQIELDIRAAVGPNPARGALHVIALQPNQLCRINGILKLSYQVAAGIN